MFKHQFSGCILNRKHLNFVAFKFSVMLMMENVLQMKEIIMKKNSATKRRLDDGKKWQLDAYRTAIFSYQICCLQKFVSISRISLVFLRYKQSFSHASIVAVIVYLQTVLLFVAAAHRKRVFHFFLYFVHLSRTISPISFSFRLESDVDS